MLKRRAWIGKWGGWTVAALLGVPLMIAATSPGSKPKPSVAGTSELDEDNGGTQRIALGDVHGVHDLASAVGKVLGRPVHVHEDQIEWATQVSVAFDVPETDVRTAFRLFNAALEDSNRQVGWCVFGDHVEIGESSHMRELRRVRRVYEIGAIVNGIGGSRDPYIDSCVREGRIRKVIDLIESDVHASDWQDNGGELASVQVVETSLMIRAPIEMQDEISDLLRDVRAGVVSGWRPRVALSIPSRGTGGGGRSPGCFAGP